MPEFSSFGEYRSTARSFMSGGAGEDVLEGFRLNGDILRFDPTTQYFGVMSREGIIRTFFRPESQNYFYEQFR